MSAENLPASLHELSHVHFLGLAGVGVSAVAQLMLAAGVSISGTDAKDLPVLEVFRKAGVPVKIGYSADNIHQIEAELGTRISTVVASSIATAGNPEYEAAQAAGAQMLHRSEGLALCMKDHRSIAIAGTHGKTTTASMTAMMLTQAGVDPSYAVGATIAGLGANAAAGSGPWLVAEADESDASLLNYRPEIAVVTNVEPDHLDHYGTAEAVEQVFVDFVDRILPSGTLIICAEDPGARKLVDSSRHIIRSKGLQVIGYGGAAAVTELIATAAQRGTVMSGLDVHTEPGPGTSQYLSISRSNPATQSRAQGGSTLDAPVLDTPRRNTETSSFELGVAGQHNALNATAAIAAGLATGLSLDIAANAVAAFQGTARRFELIGHYDQIRVIDDYAHHPTEVAAVLRAAQTASPQGRVHAVFQPHLFSRTQVFATEFGQALELADTARVLEIYPAREKPLAGVSSELLGHPVRSAEEAIAELIQLAQPGDILLTIGAGDVTALAPRILDALISRKS